MRPNGQGSQFILGLSLLPSPIFAVAAIPRDPTGGVTEIEAMELARDPARIGTSRSIP